MAFNCNKGLFSKVAVYLFICSTFVSGLKELQDRIARARDSNEDLTEAGRNLVDLHGEMVLLEIYSVLNYTGTSFRSLL